MSDKATHALKSSGVSRTSKTGFGPNASSPCHQLSGTTVLRQPDTNSSNRFEGPPLSGEVVVNFREKMSTAKGAAVCLLQTQS